MKKYYLHNGTESSGPFDIEELKAKKITKASPVWFEGMQQWKTAGEIPELFHLFIANPPAFAPFIPETIVEPTSNVETKTEVHKIMGLSKNTFFIICIALFLLIGITVLKTIEDKRSQELKIKNHKTEIENYQLELQQKQLQEQKYQSVIEEKIEADRIVRDKKSRATNRLLEIEKLVVNYQNQLDETESKLKNASGFKLLRTAAEKEKQLNLLQNDIKNIQKNMNQLKEESDQLKLELEKIPK